MTEHPILFNADMVRAILGGRKTQTRRPVVCRRDVVSWSVEDRDGKPWPGYEDRDGDWQWMQSPFGVPGDVLWVRECWGTSGQYKDGLRYEYRALPADNEAYRSVSRWYPSIHMPRDACRIFLRVKRVWVERVQDIGPGRHNRDIEAEGFPVDGTPPLKWFGDLWDSIYATKPGLGFDENPWVWACEFEVTK